MKTHLAAATLLAFVLAACSSPTQENQDNTTTKSKSQVIIDKAITYHGMRGLNDADFSVTFRARDYTYSNKKGAYQYTRMHVDSTGATVKDVMNNDGLIRYTDNKETELLDEKRAAYTRSVNSVIYFFRLPFGLNDDAVKKEYMGETEIKGKTYHEIKVTFAQDGGGEDFDDVFLYWFDKDDYSMDYLAYLYHTDGGGIRFREAINPRRINGVMIQDYINLKPEDEKIDIMTIDELYNAGELRELSKIINESVKFTFR